MSEAGQTPRDALEAALAALEGHPAEQRIIRAMLEQGLDRNDSMHWLVATLGLTGSMIKRVGELLGVLHATGEKVPARIISVTAQFCRLMDDKLNAIRAETEAHRAELAKHIARMNMLEQQVAKATLFGEQEMSRRVPEVADAIAHEAIARFDKRIAHISDEVQRRWYRDRPETVMGFSRVDMALTGTTAILIGMLLMVALRLLGVTDR